MGGWWFGVRRNQMECGLYIEITSTISHQNFKSFVVCYWQMRLGCAGVRINGRVGGIS